MGKNMKEKTTEVKKDVVEEIKEVNTSDTLEEVTPVEENVVATEEVETTITENQTFINKEEIEDKKRALKDAKAAQKEAKKAVKELEKNARKVKNASGRDTKIIIGIVIVVILLAFGIFGFYFYQSNMESVATFEGGKVTKADYEVYYKTFASMLEYYGYPASIIPEQIANKAALDAIIVQMAKKEKIEISQEDKDSIEKVFSDKDQLAQFTEQGIDLGRMRNLYYNDYLITTYINKIASEATDEEILAYLKTTNGEDIDLAQYNTSHILFKTTDASNAALDEAGKAAAKQKAEAALVRVKNGEDFATVAKEISEDTGTKEKGGVYTCYGDGNTLEEYINAAKTLKDGEIYATIVETSAGYHIIKLDSKVENGRLKNDTERKEFADKKINALGEEKKLVIDTDAVNKLVESLTGKKVGEEDTTEDTTTDDTTTEDTADTEGTDTGTEQPAQ